MTCEVPSNVGHLPDTSPAGIRARLTYLARTRSDGDLPRFHNSSRSILHILPCYPRCTLLWTQYRSNS